MNIRHCTNPEKIFDVFTTLSYSPTDAKDVHIESKIPSHYGAEDILKQIPKFAYPCAYNSLGVEHYTFVLTDFDAKFLYGFCRMSQDHNHIICLLSRLPWFDTFYKLLNKISELTSGGGGGDGGEAQVQLLLEAVYNTKVPSPNEPCNVLPGSPLSFTLDGPELDKLASIPDNRNLTVYFSAIDYELMITVYASMLNERRIVITSKKLSKLTACCHAAAALLYPCYWQHLFIPVLPAAVIEMVSAPMPYIIGVHSSLMAEARRNELGDALVLNVDDGTLEDPHDDRSLLPSEAVSSLKRALKQKIPQDDNVSRAFLKCLVQVIGGYKDGLKYHAHDDSVEFDEELYIAGTTSSSERSWREIVCRMQYFSVFVDDRLGSLNTGQGFSDEFETELSMYSVKSNSSHKYKEFVTNVKKQGKKIKVKSQHKIGDLGKRVQDSSKTAYKFIKTRLDEKLAKDYSIIERGGGGGSHYIMKDGEKANGPMTITAPPMRPSRPPRPGSKDSPTENPQLSTTPRRTSYERALKYKPLSLTDDDLPTPGCTDLMNDPMIQSFLTKSHSTANIHQPHSLNSTPPSNSPSGSVNSLGGPVAPPRRKKISHQKYPLTPNNNDGFTDNFSDMNVGGAGVDVTDSTPPQPSSLYSGQPADLLSMDSDYFAPSPRSSQPERVDKTSSYLSDLDGLELSPTSHKAPPTAISNGLSQLDWTTNTNKPNYNISTDHVVNRTSGSNNANSNPFRTGFVATRQDSYVAATNSPILKTVMAPITLTPQNQVGNGQAGQRTTPTRPPLPTLKPQTISASAKKADPLNDINPWSQMR